MSCLVILSPWTRAPSDGTGGVCRRSTLTSGLPTVCVSMTPPTTLMVFFFVPSVLLLQSSDLASSQHSFGCATETICAVAAHSQPCCSLPAIYLGFIRFSGPDEICLVSTFSTNGTNCDRLPYNLSIGVRPFRPFRHLDGTFPASPTSHGSTDESLTGSCVIKVTLDRLHDSAKLHDILMPVSFHYETRHCLT